MHNNEISVKLLTLWGKIQCILTIGLWVLVMFGFDEPYIAGLTVAAALAHECGHLAYALFKMKTEISARGRLSGPRIKALCCRSYRDELGLLFSGPLMNLVLFVLTLPFFRFSGYLQSFGVLNLATAFSNLLPMVGHDGYGIALTLLRAYGAPRSAFTALKCVSVGLGFFGCVLALFLMERASEGYWLFAIFYFSLISELLGN